MRTSGSTKRQPWFWPAKLLLKRLSGKELWLKPELEFERIETADWSFIGSKLGSDSIVYSLGVGDSIDFDLGLIERFGATVFAFNPAPYSMEWVFKQNLPDKFVFKPWTVFGEYGKLRLYRRVNRQGKSAEVMWTAGQQAGDPDDFIDTPAYTIGAIMDLLQQICSRWTLKAPIRYSRWAQGCQPIAGTIAGGVSPSIPGHRQSTYGGEHRTAAPAWLQNIRIV